MKVKAVSARDVRAIPYGITGFGRIVIAPMTS